MKGEKLFNGGIECFHEFKSKSLPSLMLSAKTHVDVIRDCTLFIEGTGLEIFTKSYLKKSLFRPESMTKILVPYTTSAKMFVSRMLKKCFP